MTKNISPDRQQGQSIPMRIIEVLISPNFADAGLRRSLSQSQCIGGQAMKLFCLVILCLLVGSPTIAGEYRLGVGDTIRLRVHEWPDVSGEFRVNPEGHLILPVVGIIPAEERTTEELTLTIRNALRERLRGVDQLDLVLEISDFRPFYILGTENAGEYPFRPGLTVLQAVSLAGGPARALVGSDARPERDAIRAQGEMQAAQATLDELQVRLARLRAEIDNAPAIDLGGIATRSEEPIIAAALATESEIFARRQSLLAGARAHEARMIALHKDELAAIAQSITARDEQIALIEEEYETSRSLGERGLTTTQRTSAIRQELATIITLRRDLDTRIVRINQNIEQSRQTLAETEAAHLSEALREVQEVQSSINAARTTLTTATRLLAEAQQFDRISQGEQLQGKGPLAYGIQRQSEEGFVTLPAGPTTAVAPGDVVIVERAGIPLPGEG